MKLAGKSNFSEASRATLISGTPFLDAFLQLGQTMSPLCMGMRFCCHVIAVAAEGCFQNWKALNGIEAAMMQSSCQYQGNIQVPSVLHVATHLRTYLWGIVLTFNSYFARIFACRARFTSIRPLIHAIAAYMLVFRGRFLERGCFFLECLYISVLVV